jgi:hypothetical protein
VDLYINPLPLERLRRDVAAEVRAVEFDFPFSCPIWASAVTIG